MTLIREEGRLRIHPNDLALEEFYLSLGSEHRTLLEHVAHCLACRDRIQTLIDRSQRGAWSDEEVSYEQALDHGEQILESRRAALEKERSDAPALFVELMETPPEQRILLLRNLRRFQTWGLFELFIERSLEMGVRDPTAAEELALLSLRVSDTLDYSYYGSKLIEDLRARAWAHLANSRRIRSDLKGAEEAFEEAEVHLAKGTRDPVEKAIFLDLKASLRRGQRRFEEALRLLRRAVTIFVQYGHHHRAGRALVNMSIVHHYRGEQKEVIPLLHRALELINPELEPRLLLCTRHNLTFSMADCGHFQEAWALYFQTRPLYRDFTDAWTQNRRKWVKGKIVRGLGQAGQAESLFLAARDGFVEEGIPYDTALVSLELATLYAEQGRTADLKRLAEEMLPIFSSLHIHREALAALAFLRQAAEAETASLEVVTRVASYLRRAQHDPSLRFEEVGQA
jgi:tetratricopeptide (TPR) repeat protein